MNAINEQVLRRPVSAFVLTLAFLVPAACTQQQEAEQQAEAPGVEALQTRISELQAQLEQEQAALEQLREEKARVEEQLPQGHQVTEGQSHWQISFDFLTEEGLAPEEAEQTLANAFLLDPILEGQQAWNFYDGETFGTFVTQDQASVSPGDLMREKEATAERMRDQIASLQQDLAMQETRLTRQLQDVQMSLESKTSEVTSLRSHIDSLQRYQESLASRLADFEERLSSVYYLAGSRDQLGDEGKIREAFLGIGGVRLGTVQSEDFQSLLDLREMSEIELQAEQFNLSRIDDVTVLPRRWEEGLDYQVQVASDGRSATVELLNPEKFRLNTMVLVVDS